MGWFVFEYTFSFDVPAPDPVLQTGRLELAQGEILILQLTHVPDGIKPKAQTELGLAVFLSNGDGEWIAAAPVGNTRQPGKYPVKIDVGNFSWEISVAVQSFPFKTQNLIINTSNPVISEANSAKAYQQYREKIPPLFDTFDETVYWKGTFIEPTAGRISTEFGMTRYTNSDWSNPRYHWGVDIAAGKGTPVKATNDGRVVLAEYLLNTGNTVVIEHGGGLKSYYYHMDSLQASNGQIVQKGSVIGTVGSTGYSTGAHLHFEMRIGNQAINPTMLFNDSASLYYFELLFKFFDTSEIFATLNILEKRFIISV